MIYGPQMRLAGRIPDAQKHLCKNSPTVQPEGRQSAPVGPLLLPVRRLSSPETRSWEGWRFCFFFILKKKKVTMVEAGELFMKEKKDKVGWPAESTASRLQTWGQLLFLVSPVECGSRSFCVVDLPPPVWSTGRGDTHTQQGSSWKGSARLQSWSSRSQEERCFWSSAAAFFLKFFSSSWVQNKYIGNKLKPVNKVLVFLGFLWGLSETINRLWTSETVQNRRGQLMRKERWTEVART